MKVVFLGTRGYIKPKSTRHRMHTATLLVYRHGRVMIDCGESWLGKFSQFKPRAIVITHAHPDHAFGLKEGSPCPIYATAEAWKVMNPFPIPGELRHVLKPRSPRRIAGITFEAFPVVHSVIAPAVGYRISAGGGALFYVPDVARIPAQSRALSGIRTYVGDGATITRSLFRHERRGGQLIGHASIETQLGWCKKERVPQVIVTHCGSAIVAGDQENVRTRLRKLASQYGILIELAHDGMEIVI